MQKLSIVDIEYRLQMVLVALIVLPWLSFFGFHLSYNADFNQKTNSGELSKLHYSVIPIYTDRGVQNFLEKAISSELSAKWDSAISHYTKRKSHYFNDTAWRHFVDFQNDDGVAEYLERNKINRFVVPLDRAIVVKKYRADAANFYVVEGIFLSTFRSRTDQRSTALLVHAVIRTAPPSHGNALEIVVYNQEKLG